MKPFLSITLLVACTVWTASSAWPDSDDAKVRQVITDVAEAYMAFPQTRDRQSVVRSFAPDYTFFDDAEVRSFQDFERTLAELEEDLARGPIVITEQITDLAVHVDVAVAWATYQDRVTIVRDGDTTEYAALCTAILHKTQTEWVYQHEHCSSSSPGNDTDLQERATLTRNQERVTAE